VSCAKKKQLNQSRCHCDVDSGGPKEACVRWGSDPYTRRGNFEGERGPAQYMPDGRYTRINPAGASTWMPVGV